MWTLDSGLGSICAPAPVPATAFSSPEMAGATKQAGAFVLGASKHSSRGVSPLDLASISTRLRLLPVASLPPVEASSERGWHTHRPTSPHKAGPKLPRIARIQESHATRPDSKFSVYTRNPSQPTRCPPANQRSQAQLSQLSPHNPPRGSHGNHWRPFNAAGLAARPRARASP